MNRNERVLKIVEEEGMTYSDFARRIGVTKHLVSNWKNKNQTVPDKYLVSIIMEFPDVNARWLVTGSAGNESEEKERETFEQYRERFEKSYKDTIKLLQSSVQDKERIIKLKDEIIQDIRQMNEMLKKKGK